MMVLFYDISHKSYWHLFSLEDMRKIQASTLLLQVVVLHHHHQQQQQHLRTNSNLPPNDAKLYEESRGSEFTTNRAN